MRAIRLVEVDTVPTLREVSLDLHTVGAITSKIEVVGSDRSLVRRWVDLAGKGKGETVGLLGLGVTS